MASVDHKQYVKNYLKSKKDGARHQESLAIRHAVKHPTETNSARAGYREDPRPCHDHRDAKSEPPKNISTAGTSTSSGGVMQSTNSRPKSASCRNEARRPLAKPKSVTILSRNKCSVARSVTIITLPDELQLRILSYLPAGDLLICACVCKHWCHLATDNVLWKKHFHRLMAKKEKGERIPVPRETNDPQFWKWQCVRRYTDKRNQVLKLLNKIDNYTGLPKNTEKCLQSLAVIWRLAFVDRDSVESFLDHRDMFQQRMSLSVRWYSLEMPPVGQLKKLRLYAACPVFFEKGKTLKNNPCQMSLLYEFDLEWSKVVSKVKPVASDERIELRIVSPLMIATWKDGGEIAFISACLHNYQLVEACVEADRKRASLQRRQENHSSMFGFNMTMELRNQRQSFWSDQFRSIYFDKDEIVSGKATLKLISSDQSFKHTPIQRRLDLPWKTDLFKNILKNVCILDLVLLNDRNVPVWCVSTPVQVANPANTSVVYDYDGEFYCIEYEDNAGSVHMQLIWQKRGIVELVLQEEDIGHFMMTSLQVKLDLARLGVTSAIQ